MKRYLKYIFLSLVSAALAVSCLEELEPTPSLTQTDDVTVLVPRVKSFTNQYVTRAGYNEDEAVIKSLKVLIFYDDGALAHTQDMPVDTRTITLNKSMINSPSHKGKLSNATVVMLANIDLTLLKKANGEAVQSSLSSLTLDELAGCTYYPKQNIILSSDLGTSAFDGFPMIGGTSVDLTSTSATNQQDPVVIDLKILFAKIEFEICVEQGSENQGDGMQFTLDSWAINNVSQATTLAVPTDKGEPVRDFMGNIPREDDLATADEATASSQYTTSPTSGNLPETKTTALNVSPLKFTFYMAESRYNPGTYTYPINDLHESFKQQFKPEVAKTQGGSPAVGMASYVQLEGAYKDYRGTSWNVDYTIYLGKNSYDNFHVDRNSLYKNVISIKGIRDRQAGSYGEGEGDVWIDHRVNVEYNDSGADDHVTITRETLIDSHIEVRPLRVSLRNDYVAAAIYLPKYPLDAQGKIIYNTSTNAFSWGQVQEIEGGTNENWIAIENNNGAYNKGKLYCPNGKRKYFTTSLIEELHLDNNAEGNGILKDANENKFISLTDGECAWIYFDENSTTNQRRARIDVVFYKSDGMTVTETFDVYQAGLEESGGIKFESYEEYLHSYDFEDQYGLNTSPTDYSQQGLAWGMMTDSNGDGTLDGYQLSENYIVKSVEGGEDIVGKSDRYDYGHSKDFPDYYTKEKSGQQWVNVDLTKNTGVWFTSRASAKASMTVMDMGTRPTSAYQYCLSKNKFHEDPHGEDHKMEIRWYLPDVYELQTILQSDSFDDFESEAFYWSSQPAYSSSLLGIVSENAEYARAISSTSNSKSTDFNRAEQHRIRCAYYADGIDTPMPDRIPDGLGGLIKIPMKAYESYENQTSYEKGFFYGWLKTLNDTTQTSASKPDYAFPKGEKAETFDDFIVDGIRYYDKDPSKSESWTYGSINIFNNTLYHYPGLSPKEIVTDGLLYVESSDDKIYQRSESVIIGQQIVTVPTNDELASRPLDYLDETDYLTISLGNGSNSSQSPSYSYRREDKVTSNIYTSKWEIPTYEKVSIDEPSGSDLGEIQIETVSAAIQYGFASVGDEYIYNGKTYIIKEKKNTGSTFRPKYVLVLSPVDGGSDIEIQLEDQLASSIYNSYDIGDDYEYESVLYKITNKRTSGSIISRKYYFTLGPTTISKDGFKYIQGTGGWGKEGKPKSESGTVAPVVDKFEFFGGNTLTITAKEGYVIRSIKINYSGSNNVPYGQIAGFGGGASNDRFLRIVETLPSGENTSPQNMSYSGDGDFGWFKWAPSSESNDVSTVTLRLVTYKVTESFSIGGINFRPASFSYTNPANVTGYASDFDTSIVIDSFEIRIGEVENAN